MNLGRELTSRAFSGSEGDGWVEDRVHGQPSSEVLYTPQTSLARMGCDGSDSGMVAWKNSKVLTSVPHASGWSY